MSLLEAVWYFSFYSALGFLLELAYRSLVARRIVYPGFLYGPWLPIYGFGLLAVLLALTPLKGNLPLFLAGAFFVTSALEYVTGAALERLLGVRLWDYRDKLLNIHGRVALEFSLAWTGLSYLFVYWIHPLVARAGRGMMESIWGQLGGLLLVIAFSADAALSLNQAIYLKKKISALELLRQEIEELRAEAEERLDALRLEYELRVKSLLDKNRKFLVYSNPKLISQRFPRVMESLREARERIRHVRIFKEDEE